MRCGDTTAGQNSSENQLMCRARYRETGPATMPIEKDLLSREETTVTEAGFPWY